MKSTRVDLTDNGSGLQLSLTIPQKFPARRNLLCRFSVLSAVAHLLLLGLITTWAGSKLRHLPPVQVITVDLPRMNSVVTPPAAQVVRQQSRPAPRPASAPTRPRTEVPRPTRAVPDTPSAAAPIQVLSRGDIGAPSAKPSVSHNVTTPPLPVAPPLEAAPPLASTGRTAKNSQIRTLYLQRCRGLIERHKEYPVMARKGRVEGTTHLRGTLERDGNLRQCVVARTSGSVILDNAALRAVRSVGQFPPVPVELHGEELLFELPVSFRLSNK